MADLTGAQQWATKWGMDKGVLKAGETATGGLLDSRLANNSALQTDYTKARNDFMTTSGVRPTTIASQNPYQQQGLYEMGQGTGQANSALFNPLRDAQKASLESATGAYDAAGKQYDYNGYKKFMNPFIDEVINRNADNTRRQFAISNNRINEGFAEAGGYGSTAQGVERSLNTEAQNRQISDMDAQLRAQGYDSATNNSLNLFNSDRNTNLARAGGYESVASGYGNALTGAVGLDQYGRGIAERATDRKLTAGNQIQGQNQAEIDAFYAEKNRAQQYPWQQNQYLQQILQGYPTGESKKEITQGVGAVEGGIGGALIGSQLGDYFFKPAHKNSAAETAFANRFR